MVVAEEFSYLCDTVFNLACYFISIFPLCDVHNDGLVWRRLKMHCIQSGYGPSYFLASNNQSMGFHAIVRGLTSIILVRQKGAAKCGV